MAEKRQSVSWEEGETLDYVTLAKAGGRKDLLAHVEYKLEDGSDKVVSGQGVEWFAHPTPPPPTHSSYTSTLSNSWMTWNLPPLTDTGNQPPPINKARSLPVKLPQLKEGVDFSRLLALDYQREWLDERHARQAEQQNKAKLKKVAQKRKLREHTKKARKIAGVDSTSDTRDQQKFVMKRFANIPARVKLPQL